MGEPRGPDVSGTGDAAQRLVYWVMGLLLALLSVGRLPGSAAKASAEPQAATETAATTATASTPSTAASPAIPASTASSRFSAACAARAVHAECCDGWRLLDDYRRLYEPASIG